MNTPKRIIRMADMPAYTGLNRTRLKELVAQNKFPAPLRLSARRIGWLESEIAAWQASRVAERDEGGKS